MARFLRTDTNSSGGHSRLPKVIYPARVYAPIRVQLADLEDRGAHNLRQRSRPQYLTPAQQFSSRTNLLQNAPGFDTGVGSGWGPDTNATLTRITSDGAPPSPGACGRWTNSIDSAGIFTETVTLNPRSTYTFSVWLRNNGGANTAVTLLARETSGFSAVFSSNIAITSQWTRYTVTFQAHATVAGHIFYVVGTSGTNFDVLVDAFQVEAGSDVTDFIDSPFTNPGVPVTVSNTSVPVAGFNKALGPRLPLQTLPYANSGPEVRLVSPLSGNQLNRRKAKPFLRAPVVVFAPESVVYEPIAGFLTKPRDTAPATTTFIRPPILTPPTPFVARPLQIKLAPSTKIGRKPRYKLSQPVVVTAAGRAFGPRTRLADPRSVLSIRRRPEYRLAPPTVVGPVLAPPINVTLAASAKQARKAQARLPVVISSCTPILSTPPIVDDFNRANEDPLAGSWTNATAGSKIVDRTDEMAVVSLHATAGTTSNFAAARWNAQTFITPAVAAFNGAPNAPNAWIGIVNASNQGYFIDLENGFLFLDFNNNGTWSSVGTFVFDNAFKQPADWMITHNNGFIQIWWRRPGYPWTLAMERTDTRFVGPWFGFIATNGAGVVLDDFRISELDYDCGLAETEITTSLSYAAKQARKTTYKLGAPTVINQSAVYPPISVHLADIEDRGAHTLRQRQPKSFLRPPVFYAAGGRILGSLAKPRDTVPQSSYFLRPPTVLASDVFYGPRVDLARSLRGAPKSRLLRVPAAFQPFRPALVHLAYAPTRTRAKPHLSPPTVVGPVLASPISVTLAPQRRGVPNSVLRAPAVVGPVLARHIATSFAPQRRGVPSSQLQPPAVVAPVLARVTETALVRIRPTKTTYVLRPPVVVTAAQEALARAIDTTLAPQRRGVPKSHLEPPAVVETARGQIRGFLAKPRDTSPKTTAFLRPPVVLFANSAFPQGPLVGLAYSSRGIPKSRLAPPTVVAAAAQTYYGPKVELARSFRGQPKSRLLPVPAAFQPFRPAITHLTYSTRGRAKSALFEPAVVAPVLARAIDVTLAPQKRGVPKSALRPPIIPPVAPPIDEEISVRITLASLPVRRVHSHLSPPTVVGPILAPPIHVTLAPQKRGRPEYVLREPVVVGPVLARPIDATFARIRPVATDYVLRRPVDLVDRDDLGFVRTHLAYSRRGVPKPRLAPPTVVGPVLARPISFTLARIRPRPTYPVLRHPTDLVDQQDLGYVRVHLAYSSRGVPKSRLSAPAVINVVVFIARPITVELARIRPQKTYSQVAPPFVIDAANGPQGGIGIWLAPSSRGIAKSKLGAPAIVAAVAQVYYGPSVKLADSFRGKAKPFLLRVPSAFQPFRPALVHLAYSTRGRVRSALFEPAVVGPVLAKAIDVTLAPQRRGVPKSRLLPVPAAFQPVGFVEVHLAPSKRALPKSKLAPPTVVGPVLARAVDVTLAPQRRGVPKSVLRPPIIPPVAPPIDEEIAVKITLASLPPREAHSRLSPPAVVAPVLARPVEVTLARIRPPRTLFQLKPPTVVFLAVEIYGPETSLAPSFRGTPKSFLNAPVDLVDRDDVGFLRTHLAYSLRGKPKSFLRPMGSPAVVYAPVKVVLAPSTRLPRAPHSKLEPPTVIDNRPQTYFLSVTIAYSLRGKPKSRLLPPPTIQDQPKAETVLAVTLAYSLRGKPKPKLNPPTVVAAATPYLRAIDVTLVRIRPVRTLAVVRRPTDTVGIEDQGSVQVTLTASFRGRPKSRLAPPTVVAPFFVRPTDITLVRIRPVVTSYVLRRPTDIVDQQDLGYVSVQLAYSRRGAPKPFFTGVIYDARSYAPIAVTLAPQRRGIPKSKLPTVIYAARSFAPISVALAPSFRGTPKSRLAQVIYEARVYAPIRVELAFSRRGVARSFLHQTIFAARSYAPVKVILAASPRIDRTPHSKLSTPTVVGQFVARPITVFLAPQRKSKTVSFLAQTPPAGRVYAAIKVWLAPSPRIDRAPHSRLAAPTVVTPFLAAPISVTFARTPRIPTIQFRREPILATPGFPGPTVTLATIRPPRTVARIFPPAVVNPYVAPVATFLSVNLAYSVRGRPIHHLGFVPGLSHGGIVCGVILDLTEVCQDITTDADTIIPGGILETHVVSEETTASTVIMGETLAETRVDQEIE